MEQIDSFLQIVKEAHNLKFPNGINSVKTNNTGFIWMWSESRIVIFETVSTFSEEHEMINDYTSTSEGEKWIKCASTAEDHMEFNLDSSIVNILQWDDNSVYALDTNGTLYSFQLDIHNTNRPMAFMDIEDIFSSPTMTHIPSKWKESTVLKIKDCDFVISACQFLNGMAVLAAKDKYLLVLVYSIQEFKLKFVLDLQKYTSQKGVLSCCSTSSMSPLLKQQFQDNIEVLDSEVIIIGLSSGLILWFSPNTPVKDPHVFFSAHQQVQGIHWIKDSTSGLYTHMLIVLSSGSVVIFGEHKSTTHYLSDTVKMSWCTKHYLISSNFIDCFSNEFQLQQNKEISLRSVSLPIKGVCAVTSSLDKDGLLLAATIHGSVYCLKPTPMPHGNPSQFAFPDQALLDNMFIQTQELDKVYLQLNEENIRLQAVSTAMVANSIPMLFELDLKIISG